MSVIHVAAGLPAGHTDPCTCRPLSYETGEGTILIHRIAAPEMLRPTGGLSNGVIHTGTRVHHADPWAEEAAYAICAREGCGHEQGFHWGALNQDEPPESFDRGHGYCTYPATSPLHCLAYAARPRDAAAAAEGALPDPAPQHG